MLAGSYIPVVLVTRVFNTKIKQLEIAVEQIRNVQGTIVGVVINNVEATANKFSDYYYGDYYQNPVQQAQGSEHGLRRFVKKLLGR